MLEVITGGMVTIPMGLISWATTGYLDPSMLCQLQALQTVTTSMISGSVAGALSPARLMYDEELGSFIYVSEVLGA